MIPSTMPITLATVVTRELVGSSSDMSFRGTRPGLDLEGFT
jgi:hypothetical protein